VLPKAQPSPALLQAPPPPKPRKVGALAPLATTTPSSAPDTRAAMLPKAQPSPAVSQAPPPPKPPKVGALAPLATTTPSSAPGTVSLPKAQPPPAPSQALGTINHLKYCFLNKRTSVMIDDGLIWGR
jgi:Wiskott-Aldrich syndrome protein